VSKTLFWWLIIKESLVTKLPVLSAAQFSTTMTLPLLTKQDCASIVISQLMPFGESNKNKILRGKQYV
jgi:hypothetical protein